MADGKDVKDKREKNCTSLPATGQLPLKLSSQHREHDSRGPVADDVVTLKLYGPQVVLEKFPRVLEASIPGHPGHGVEAQDGYAHPLEAQAQRVGVVRPFFSLNTLCDASINTDIGKVVGISASSFEKI